MVELLKLTDEVAKKKKNVSDLLDALVEDALERRASDIHIEAKEGNNLLIRYRIDGVLQDIFTIGDNLEESIVFIIKVRAKLRTDVRFAPQDGKILFKIKKSEEQVKAEQQVLEEEEKKEKVEEENEKQDDEKKDEKPDGKSIVKKVLDEISDKKNKQEEFYKVDARVSTVPVTFGEKVVIRLLSQANKSFALKDLGFGEKELVSLEKSYREPYGLILATGPTGSGKTTTLYSILKILNTKQVNITTIEDPVEYSIEGVNHIQINNKADLTFVNGLRSILRQDPDIIMVGEIRDKETANITVNSALTGHLVLSTLHANDAISTIPRLIDMGIEPFLIASTLNIIVSQRLARRLCPHCKVEYTVSKDEKHKELLRLREDLQKFISPTDKLYRAKGCKECNNTGYAGRVGMYEILEINKAVRDVIISNPTNDRILEVAKKNGFKLMIEEGIAKLKEGVTDIEELIKVIALKE